MFQLPALAWIALAFAPTQSRDGTPDLSEQERALVERLLAVARETAPPTPPASGGRAITGRVATETGAPLAGARVIAREIQKRSVTFLRRPAWDPAYHPAPDLESRLRRSLEFVLKSQRREHAATSDADGRFAITGLDGERYELVASADHHALSDGTGVGWNRWSRVVEPDAEVELVAKPLLDATFTLTLPDGAPPSEAIVAFRRLGDRDDAWEQTWTPDAPRIAAPAGDWMVAARVLDPESGERGQEMRDFVSEERLVAITPAAPTVAIALRSLARLSGVIRGSSGPDRRHVNVVIVPLLDGETTAPPGERSGTRRRDTHQVTLQSSRTGEWHFDDPWITAGRWSVALTDYSSGERLDERVVDVTDRPVEVAFDLAPPDASERVPVRVRTADGEALDDFVLELSTAAERDGRRSSTSAREIERRSEPGGGSTFWRRQLSDRNLLVARHPRHGFVAATVARDAAEIELRFVAPALATLDLSGGPARTAKRAVALVVDGPMEQVDGDLAPRALRFDNAALPNDGRIELGPLPPGTYRARLTVDPDRDDSNGGAIVASTTWTLAAGPVALAWRWPELSTLRVTGAAKGGWQLESYERQAFDSVSGSPRWFGTAADGEVVFVDVPSGLHRLTGPDRALMRIELPQRDPVAFRAMEIDALRVVITEPGGALVHEGLAHGDLVVGIDGAEFSSREQLGWIRGRLDQQKVDRVTLTVERAGKRFEVLLALVLLNDAREAGGIFVEDAR